MARYPLASLLILRDERERRATKNLAQRTQQVRQAQQQLEQSQSKLDTYLKWREEEIERRYQAILGQAKSQKEIADFNSGIGALYAQEEGLRQALLHAQEQLTAAKNELAKAQTALKEAHKAHEKLLQHREIWLIKERALEEYRADQELEDFKVKEQDPDLAPSGDADPEFDAHSQDYNYDVAD